ncbi:hypothetical protein SO802_014820 [Lithocarpus litseifolius]|uniref:non-specific serine/threonine protein kinase n=1 Tax=Lithocarpus litseifolius TaxID=425828 RepID=A0AAW2CTB1_9ROSI
MISEFNVPEPNNDGELVIYDSRIYSPLTNTSAGKGTHAMLLNTGNFVLTDGGSEVLWQSFDHPTDTLLPGMTLGRNDWSLKSWKSKEDPAPEDEQEWNSSLQSSGCGDYLACGTFSICDETAQEPCGCLPGFKPVSADVWSKGNVPRGCVRETALHCTNNSDVQNEGFLRMTNIDWLDSPLSLDIRSDKECESACLKNCSCIAYAYEDNYRSLPISRNESSPAVTPGATEGVILVRAKQLVTIMTISLPLATLMLGLFVYCVWRKLRMTSKGEDLVQLDLGMTIKSENSEQLEKNKRGDIRKKEVKMPLFSFASVSAATDNFSDANKLGEGGFGPVYKGILLKGDLVAVKRLSRRSGQGWEELKNEAMLIAKLQHNNLVRLLGCCIERDEKILIYEYMPNKSLDFFIFGVAQGLLYLHQYSRLRIIHRDLKASNILLDSEMNLKISDFEMARIFGGNESQANTDRIVGTYGYMSPEYALEGLFSIKSDVFSFGVLLVEIVRSRKNTGFYQTDSFHLLGYAWELWTSDRGSDLVDPLLDDVSSIHVALKYVNIGLLCVQESAADRPTMSDVVAMLSNESTALPYPKQPAFLNMKSVMKAKTDNSRAEIFSVSDATVSIMEGR